MRCVKCNSDSLSVLDSRADGDAIRRRRECQICGYRFNTFERVELAMPMVVKKDGRRETFETAKIRTGVVRACEKRPVSMEVIDRTVDAIEHRIHEMYIKELSSEKIGGLVIQALKEIDKIAYVRFASVYREFSDVSQFVETLQSLIIPMQEKGIKDRKKSKMKEKVKTKKAVQHNSKIILSSKILLFFMFSLLFLELQASAEILDAVIASVDGKPITLTDLNQRLTTKHTIKEISSDAEAKAVLEEIISERLLEAEAEYRKLGVLDEEINAYIDEVAKRNALSRAEFEQALAQERKTINDYKKEVKFEIIKSKVSSAYLKSVSAVTDEEIKQYAKSHGMLEKKSGISVKLRQILFKRSKHSADKIQELVDAVITRLDEGEDFEDLVKELSDGSQALEGGSLGEVELKDLDKAVFEAVAGLEEEEVSRPISNDDSIRIFYIEEKIDNSENEEEPQLDESTKEKIRKTLETEKMQTESANFFNKKLYEDHAVEKKI